MLHNHTFAHVSKIIQFTFIAHVFHSAVKNVKSQPCLAYSFVWFRFAPLTKEKIDCLLVSPANKIVILTIVAEGNKKDKLC